MFDRVCLGLIPAHAGKTIAIARCVRPCWAHPRSRGENCPGRRWSARGWGSSPLTRGKHGRQDSSASARGLIPAHAGKTVTPEFSRAPLRAHPRSRGENPTCRCRTRTARGSSPLTRGKPVRRGRVGVLCGLIPAHAGKTGWGPCSTFLCVGSSPLTRGKPACGAVPAKHLGLIPAHAGKTTV